MTPAVVELKDVSVCFRSRKGWLRRTDSDIHAVSEVSLAVQPAEILALVGESGCGKTTLGRVALGLTRPTAGTVTYLGEQVWRRRAKRTKPVGQVIHQDSYSALNPVKTIHQTLSAPLRRHGTPSCEVKARVEELLRIVGVIPPEYFFNKYPHHLSGGMRQRVVLARSIIPKPQFILADEPVSMVDASLRLSILDLMMKLNRELGVAFLYITHDLATARYIARRGRIAVMYLGRIVETGVLADVFERPLHPYLQALLAAAPIPDPKVAKKRKALPLKSLEVAGADAIPIGCAFHPRCPYAKEICAQEVPQLEDRENGHLVACHRAEVIPPWHLM
ncbi:ABC transporter ATP-binding protein [Candidatus Bipolaricaulota bacterium]|nr:ABC transporter ATP-binding protein [Candidatus Bipolaricaulota bacterium]